MYKKKQQQKNTRCRRNCNSTFLCVIFNSHSIVKVNIILRTVFGQLKLSSDNCENNIDSSNDTINRINVKALVKLGTRQ